MNNQLQPVDNQLQPVDSQLQLVSTADAEKHLPSKTSYFATKVSPEFYKLVVDTFKIDAQTDFGRFSLRTLEYFLFPRFMNQDDEYDDKYGDKQDDRYGDKQDDEYDDKQDDEYDGYVVIPCETVAELAGKPYNRGLNTLEMLTRFSKSVWPLDIKEHRYTEGLARCAKPDAWPEKILLARTTEIERIPELRHPQKNAKVRAGAGTQVRVGAGTRVRVGAGTRVYMDTGKSVTVHSSREEKQRYEDLASVRKALLPPFDYPAYPLLKLLNNQSQRAIRSIFNRNIDAVIEAAFNMPVLTRREENQRSNSLTLINHLMDYSQMYYKTSEKSVRVSAVDTTIHLLPRELRKIALTGCHSLDLKSAQLALAARYWEIGPLTDFLEKALSSNTSYWDEILTHLKLSPAGKSAIKRATYAMLFGRMRNKLVSCLKEELQRDEALTAVQAGEAAAGFLRYPLVRAILQARTKKMQEVISQGGLEDAFGKFITVTDREEARSAMALQLQSYELKLISAILPILESEKRLHVCSWLHDGLSVYCADPAEAPRQLKRLEQAIVKEAALMQVYTKLEIELVAAPV